MKVVKRSVWRLKKPAALGGEWIVTGLANVRTAPGEEIAVVRVRYNAGSMHVERYERSLFLRLFAYVRKGS